ncbi:DUF6716 putative glycosyltransferase [Streptomyces cacaoi]|uniref:DUF6716 putative glycosyltransferase n=1 Tax=Streptomyces cacaoi TaxID=1898 RepID=UPI003749E302
MLADSDTRWKWGALTARRLAPGARLDGLLLRGRATPTPRQLAEVGVPADSLREVTTAEFLQAASASGPAAYDMIVLACVGGAVQAMLHGLRHAVGAATAQPGREPGPGTGGKVHGETHGKTHGQPERALPGRRPVLVTGYVGVVYEKLTDGLLLRHGADVVLANSPYDAERFRAVYEGVGADSASVVTCALPFLDTERDPRDGPLPDSGDGPDGADPLEGAGGPGGPDGPEGGDRSVADRSVADRPVTDRSMADRSVADRSAADRPVADRAAVGGDAPFTVVFAVQPSVPAGRADRAYLLRRAVAHARRHPGRQVLIKLRSKPGEHTTHIEEEPYQKLLRTLPGDGGRPGALPPNCRLVYGNMGRILDRAQRTGGLLVTVSSTAALESLHRGVPTAVLTDLGVREALGNHYFTGSGCLASWDQLDDGLLPEADEKWVLAQGVRGAHGFAAARERIARLTAQARGPGLPPLTPYYTVRTAPGYLPAVLRRYGLGPDGSLLAGAGRNTESGGRRVVRRVVRDAARGAYRHGVQRVAPLIRRAGEL